MEPGTIFVCTLVICFFFFIVIEVYQYCLPHDNTRYKHYIEYDAPV